MRPGQARARLRTDDPLAEGGPTGKTALTMKISEARARAKEGEASAAEGPDLRQRVEALLPAAVALWLLLLLAERYGSSPERLQKLEKQSGGVVLVDMLGWRVLAHLGPYQIPNFVRARLHEHPLRVLSEPLLLDQERAQALSRLGQMTQHSVAAAHLGSGSEGGDLLILEPLMKEAFGARREEPAGTTIASLAASNQVATARVILDVVTALPEKERRVSPWVLSGAVVSTDSPWIDGPQGEELRVNFMLQLLRTPANCVAAASLPEVLQYLQQPGMKAKADTWFPFRAYLLSGETPDLLRRSLRLINKQCPEAVQVPPRRQRDTPSLQLKHDMRDLWTTALLTVAWGAARAWRGVLDVKSLLFMARACGGALAGVGALEMLWRIEEAVIESEWYYEGASGSMFVGSVAMCVANAVALAWASRFTALAPFAAAHIIKDPYLDAYRSFEP